MSREMINWGMRNTDPGPIKSGLITKLISEVYPATHERSASVPKPPLYILTVWLYWDRLMNRSVMASGSETSDPTQAYINSFSPESSPEILIRHEY